MGVQSRRKPSKLFTATVYGFIWVGLLALMICCVWGTLAEIRTQAVEGTERIYAAWYFLPLLIPVTIAFCRTGVIEASKRLYLTVQLVNFTVLLGVFCIVLDLAGGSALAFFSVSQNRELFPFMKQSLFGCFSRSARYFRSCR